MLSAQIQNNNLFAEVTPIQLLHLYGIFKKLQQMLDSKTIRSQHFIS